MFQFCIARHARHRQFVQLQMAEEHVCRVLRMLVFIVFLRCHHRAYTQQWQNDVSCFHSVIDKIDVYINNVCKNLRGLERRRTPCNDDATAGGMVAAQRLGMILFTYMNIYRDSHHSGCQHGQREKLTENTVVCP